MSTSTKRSSRSSTGPKFRASWALLIIIVALFSYFAFTMLAPWQLGKDKDIVERNDQISQAYEEDPRPYQEVLNPDGSINEGHEWARVTMTGHYLPEHEILLRMRPVASGASFQSLVPFITDQGDAILVNRGWVQAGEGGTVPAITPAPNGEVTLLGMVRRAEGEHPNKPFDGEGYQQIYSINIGQLSTITGQDLGVDYVQLSDKEPGVLNPIPVPQMDRGNHLSYGYQWIAFGIMAPLGAAYFIWAEIRERRRAREEEAEMEAQMAAQAATESPAAPPAPQNTPAPAAHVDDHPNDDAPTPSRRHRARYGEAKTDHYAKFKKRGQERF